MRIPLVVLGGRFFFFCYSQEVKRTAHDVSGELTLIIVKKKEAITQMQNLKRNSTRKGAKDFSFFFGC